MAQGNNEVERETRQQGGRWYVPSPVVYGVVVSIVAMAVGGGGSGLVMAFKINQALDKVNKLPNSTEIQNWRKQQEQTNKRQNARISRLEKKVFNIKSLKNNSFHYQIDPELSFKLISETPTPIQYKIAYKTSYRGDNKKNRGSV